ncbi:MAG: hypothetical protein GY747_02665 [Planctomycetes bacterium]|nr:hypothetical protein [Planctomycetota bacterium]MCP4860655.1 hypothetical protein [Planctomycetota bacterium]
MIFVRAILALGLSAAAFPSCATNEWCPCAPGYKGGDDYQDASEQYSSEEIAAITKATAHFLDSSNIEILSIAPDNLSGQEGVVVRWTETITDSAMGESRDEEGLLVLELHDGVWTPRSNGF